MEEVEYYRAGDIVITSSRIDFGKQTFATRNVSSVKVAKPGSPYLAALCLIGCVLAAVGGKGNEWWFGAAAFLLWIVARLRERWLVLVTSGGEVKALHSRKSAYVHELRDAIAKAISSR